MARKNQSDPKPDEANEGPTPPFPGGIPRPDKGIGLERPGRITDTPGADYPPERKPFPDSVPDPGIGKP